MSTHLVDCAAEMDLLPAKKLALLCLADSADKITRIATPGQERILTWAGVKRARAMAIIAELIEEGLLERKSPGVRGHQAEFWVLPDGCCPLHGPLPHRRPAPGKGPLQQTLSEDPEDAQAENGSSDGSSDGSSPEWTPSVSPYLPVVDGANAPSTTPLRDDDTSPGTEITKSSAPPAVKRRAKGEVADEARVITEKCWEWAGKNDLHLTQDFVSVMGIVNTCLRNWVPRDRIASALASLTQAGQVVTSQSMARALRSQRTDGAAFRRPEDQTEFEQTIARARERDAAGGSSW